MSNPAPAPAQQSVTSLKNELHAALTDTNVERVMRLVPLLRERTEIPIHLLNTMMRLLSFEDFKRAFLAAEVKWRLGRSGKYKKLRIN